MDADLETIRQAVQAADLPDEPRTTVLWCLDRLPKLYRQFAEGYDTRHGDEISRLLHGVLQALAGPGHAPDVARDIADRLQAMHERFGIPLPKFSVPAAKQPRRRKAG